MYAGLQYAAAKMGPILLGAPLPSQMLHEGPWYGLGSRPDIRCYGAGGEAAKLIASINEH